jgi:tetratricopeptide (TPR) repeat protein
MQNDAQSGVDAWKTFLRGRIADERGDKEQALEAYETALSADPTNDSFRRARANALSALGRSDDAAASRIARQYELLAEQLSGPDDDPEAWVGSLERLLDNAGSSELRDLRGEARMVIW